MIAQDKLTFLDYHYAWK